jgi:hypothetical protein
LKLESSAVDIQESVQAICRGSTLLIEYSFFLSTSFMVTGRIEVGFRS